MRLLASVVLIALIQAMHPANAQTSEYEKILLPIRPARVLGAFGSEWVTQVAVTNLSTTPVSVLYLRSCGITTCPNAPPIPPGVTIFIYISLSSEVPGYFIEVERGRFKDLALTLRTEDVSRRNETWGTVIPVVTEKDLFETRFGLNDVPLEDQFRSTLRIYDFDGSTPGGVRVRIFQVNPFRDYPFDSSRDVLLLEKELTFTVPFSGGGTRGHPAYTEIPLWREPSLSNAGRVRIEIEGLDGLKEYWAFVSVTHNETQHVTVVSPE